MRNAPTSLLLILLVIGCSRGPTTPAAPSFGIRVTVTTTGQNIPAQLKFFACTNPISSASLELSLVCHLSASAFGTLESNGSVLIRTGTGAWHVGSELPSNCRPMPPYAEFFNHTVISPIVTVSNSDVTPLTLSITCL